MNGEEDHTRGRVLGVVLLVDVVGATLLVAVGLLTAVLPHPQNGHDEASGWLILAFIAMSVVAELVVVPLRHGDTVEELTFFEAVVVAGILVLPPVVAMAVPLLALLLVSVLLRRPITKTVFNIGSYAAATSVLVGTFLLISHGDPPFSAWSVLGLLVGTLLFAGVNLTALSEVLHAVEGLPRGAVWRDEWQLSATMAVGGVAVGTTVVAMATYAPVLVPFAAVPALALWYAYRAAAQHAREVERTRCLIDLGVALAAPDPEASDDGLAPAVDALRRLVLADEADLVLPPQQPELLAALGGGREPVTLPAAVVPTGWHAARAFPLDLGTEGTGALVLAPRRGTSLTPDDEAMVTALAAALAGAVRAHDARRALAEETDTLRAVIEHASDGIAVVGADGQVRLWSPALTRMTGVDASGMLAAEAPPPAAAVLAAATQGEATAYRSAPVSVMVTLATGEERDLTVSAARAREARGRGAPVLSLAVLTVRDDTSARRADRLKADFVATISHELRTPITPIKGYAQLLARRGDRMDVRRRTEALELIAERADHLGRLVDDLLLASRVSGPTKLTIEAKDVDLREIIRGTTAAFPRLADRVSVTLPDRPVMVRCDPHRAGQCLSNLLSNAEKYTPPDTTVEVSLADPGPADRLAVVAVRDHGPGIAYDQQDKVFERFYRIEDPFTMRTGGSGLGLHIAHELAGAMGGSLTLVSEPGDGCTFALALPLTAASPAASGPPAGLRTVTPTEEAP